MQAANVTLITGIRRNCPGDFSRGRGDVRGSIRKKCLGEVSGGKCPLGNFPVIQGEFVPGRCLGPD